MATERDSGIQLYNCAGGMVYEQSPPTIASVLSSAINMKVPLCEVDLRRESLAGFCFQGVALTGACFTGGHLPFARFVGCHLAGAVFTSADMHGANLSDTCLDGASFYRANLSRAVLSNADLEGACFDLADLYGVALDGIRNYWHSREIFLELAGRLDNAYRYERAAMAFIEDVDLNADVWDENAINPSTEAMAVFKKLLEAGYHEFYEHYEPIYRKRAEDRDIGGKGD